MPKRTNYLFSSLAIFVLLFVVHFLAVSTGLYWITGWFDSVSHLLGGFGIFFLIAYIFSIKGKSPTLLFVIGFSILVGILWELFELKYGITSFSSSKYFMSTSSDIAYDIVGAVVAFLFTRQKF